MASLSKHILGIGLVVVLLVSFAAACDDDSDKPPNEVSLRNWEGDISQAILDGFKEETGITVNYVPYDSQEQALADMQAGEVYDVVVLENQLIPGAVAEGLLAELDYNNIPNFKNISPNFRDLAYDPQNAHAIPYSWGTTGLVFRSDLVVEPVTGWADMWNEAYAGKLMGWPLERYIIGLALKMLGYSLNSEDPAELQAALGKLLEIKPHLTLREWEPAVAAPYLESGEIWLAIGQADDVIAAREAGVAVDYILPEEGGLLWGDNFTIQANSPRKAAAEKLINYLLQAEVSAQIINETYYWLPNDAALEFVVPELRENTAIFPTQEMLKNAEILLPLTAAGEALYADIWAQFLAEE
ncbi:MAG: spermidine/putrescine ABC transporter substrate-binding protein [Anaerolineae bacterium]|nr:spermidine/putrescine ABC transporter substrate-binding protein [Anaerolineae bacterium]